MTDENDIDWGRFPYEARRIIEANGVLLGQLEPGTLAVSSLEDGIELLDGSNGQPLGVLPRHRIAEVDRDLLRQAAAEALEYVPADLAVELVEAINAGDMALTAPVDDEWVALHVGPERIGLFKAHRSAGGSRLARRGLAIMVPSTDQPRPASSPWRGRGVRGGSVVRDRRNAARTPHPTRTPRAYPQRKNLHKMTVHDLRAQLAQLDQMRAMSTTDANGGFMIPLDARPGDHAHHRRQQQPAAPTRQSGADHDEHMAGTSPRLVRPPEWKSEAAEAADASPTLVGPSIPMFFGDVVRPVQLPRSARTPRTSSTS